MTGSGGGLRACGSLLLLGLCIWTGARAADTNYTVEELEPESWYEFSVRVEADGVQSFPQTLSAATAPNPVRNLRVVTQTNSSISLSWEAPNSTNPQNYTYCVQWPGHGDKNESRNTTDTSFTVDELQSASSYEFSEWAEKNRVPSSMETLEGYTAPNSVRNLSVETQTNSSISLSWAVPDGPDLLNYTYRVQWAGGSDGTKNHSTVDTRSTVEKLEPGTLYQVSVRAEKHGVAGSWENRSISTAPNSVRNLSVETQTNSFISLSWEVPDGPDLLNYTYRVQWAGGSDGTKNHSTVDTRYTVEKLEPGTLYQVSVRAEKHGVAGSWENRSISTAPNSVRNLSVETQTNSSISLSWEVPDGPGLLSYTYWVQWAGGSDGTKNHSTVDTRYTVEKLEPGTLYQVSVRAEKHGVAGSWENRSISTAPNSVRNLSVETQTNSSISLSWAVPDGPDLLNYTYWVQWAGGSDGTKNHSTVDTRSTVEKLEPGTLYQVSVRAEKHEVAGSWENRSISTVPNAVRSLRIQNQSTSSITLSWIAPQGPDHPPYTYLVSCTPESGTLQSYSTTETKMTLTQVEAGSLYTFTIRAERNRIRGAEKTLMGATAPSMVTGLQKDHQTNSSITLRWVAPADPCSHLYLYSVRWAGGGHPQREQDPQGHGADETHKTNETWYVVKALEPGTLYNFSVWAERSDVASATQSLRASTDPDPVIITSCVSTSGGYGIILTWSCPLGGYEAFELQVGGQLGSQDRASCGRDVSVSGLQPAQSYSATVTTLWDGLRAPPAFITCHTESAGVIAGAIVGVLLFIILMGLLVFFLKRYKETQKNSALSAQEERSFPEDIAAADFADHVRRNEKDSNCGFAEEYQHLALEGQGQSQMVASAPENGPKNRYRNVLPYDWSRVSLKTVGGEPGSDYINASFVPGLWSSQEFIATQGPLPQTVGDFWRMVWEQQSRTLVMLTNCVELGRVKCEHYWPLDAQPCTHGHLQVTLEGEEVKENWTVRDLRLRHTREQKTLSVRQFHYVAWPDHGVPNSPGPLLAFWKVLRRWLDRTPGGGPPIVHCSAGVGRTGTLIALDVLLRQLECEGVVGPFSFVKKMRESRPLMVQTEAQYVFLHQCILWFLQQSSPVQTKKEVTYENLAFENEAAIRDHYGS
uniref:Receptor-type tyrosine-protein phosphatase H n=1 Tax=Molossus molossus TaxID=27622 RepID=A0A7J8CAI7_MOLMO|nr:protein tyrosine phosphatase receptor type H [Molossus molossus]